MSFMQRLKRYFLRRTLRQEKIPLPLWHQTIHSMPIMHRYSTSERVRLRVLASTVLSRKTFSGVQGLRLTDEMRVTLATQTAILIFGFEHPETNPTLDWLRNWYEIIVYPAPFYNGRPTQFNAQGSRISSAELESGETQYQGAVIINWQDDQPHPLHAQANQVLMHELAHKLDMLNGSANGQPPLHANMSPAAWYDAFESAYKQLNQQIHSGHKTHFNPYAATHPAEFFAVCTEYFFEAPHQLKKRFPNVYQQLVLFYRQDPDSQNPQAPSR